MKRSLVEHLRSPASGEPMVLEVAEETADEVLLGSLSTPSGEVFPVIDGVPDLVAVDEMGTDQRATQDSFSTKWKLAPDYRQATLDHYRNWYLERYGFADVGEVAQFLADDQLILDCGTGHGRDAQLYAENSSAQVIGLDFSYGIRNAYRDLWQIPNLDFVQADMTRLPFPRDHFDLVACDQALHHTPDTHEAFRSLVSVLKPGGRLATYVYKVKAPIREFTDDFIRATTTAMSPEECLTVSAQITALGKALSELKAEFTLPVDIPLLEMKAGTYDVQRFIYYHMMKAYWNETMDWDSNVITNFDWYHPTDAHRHTPDEVRSWCEQDGLEIERLYECGSGITLIARKP